MIRLTRSLRVQWPIRSQITLDDDRFEVVNGQLKLKSGEFLKFENESSVNINITAEDSGNLTYNKLFTITVNDIMKPQQILR